MRDGWVGVDRDRMVALGRGAAGEAATSSVHDLGSVAILPGLVNAHTHLELSYLRDRVPPAREFVTWIRGVMAARRQQPDPQAPDIVRGGRGRHRGGGPVRARPSSATSATRW